MGMVWSSFALLYAADATLDESSANRKLSQRLALRIEPADSWRKIAIALIDEVLPFASTGFGFRMTTSNSQSMPQINRATNVPLFSLPCTSIPLLSLLLKRNSV